MYNKKIKNAIKTTYKDMCFDSKLEYKTYIEFEKNDLILLREPTAYTLSKGFKPTKRCYINSKLTMSKLKDMTYTPDFEITINNKKYVIECKGYSNDVYPYKRKLFRKILENFNDDITFFEIKNNKDIMFAINTIKNEI